MSVSCHCRRAVVTLVLFSLLLCILLAVDLLTACVMVYDNSLFSNHTSSPLGSTRWTAIAWSPPFSTSCARSRKKQASNDSLITHVFWFLETFLPPLSFASVIRRYSVNPRVLFAQFLDRTIHHKLKELKLTALTCTHTSPHSIESPSIFLFSPVLVCYPTRIDINSQGDFLIELILFGAIIFNRAVN